MALQEVREEKAEPKELVPFAVSRVSRIEFEILRLMAESKFAISTSGIFLRLNDSALSRVGTNPERKKQFDNFCLKNKVIKAHLEKERETCKTCGGVKLKYRARRKCMCKEEI